MENTNLSEEAIKLQELNFDIIDLEHEIICLDNDLATKRYKLEQLKERKKSILNYLNTDNN